MKDIRLALLSRTEGAHLLFSTSGLALQALGVYLLYAAGFRLDVLTAGLDAALFLACIYVGRWLCSRWYLSRHYLALAMYTLLVCVILSLLNWAIFKYVGRHPHAGYLEVTRDSLPYYLIGLVSGLAIKLIRAILRKEVQESQSLANQRETEFRNLQEQLSPHFLFNVLNNLYGISISNPARMPALLLKLSQLLRYSVYGGRNRFVPLADELEYLHNYIEFEQMRISDRLVLELQLDRPADRSIQIAPLVLIVFVENAFKHARNNLDQQIYIGFTLKIRDGYIRFTATNSYRRETKDEKSHDEGNGVGLTNTVQRLRLLYGDNYSLSQLAENERYFVELNLKITHGEPHSVRNH